MIAGLAGLVLAGTLAFPGVERTTAPQLDPVLYAQQMRQYEEELLFDTSRLPEPAGRHQVFVHYEPTRHRETGPFRKHENQILTGVQELYAKHGVDLYFLRYVPFQPSTNRILLRVLDEDLYRETIPGNPYIRIFSSGYADVEHRTTYVKGWLSDIDYERRWTEDFVSVSIDTVAHEIGHLLMLPHTDGVLLARGVKNLMWSKTVSVENCTGLCSDMTEEEERIIHSYLGKGQIYDAYVTAGDFVPYVQRIDRAKLAAGRAQEPPRDLAQDKD